MAKCNMSGRCHISDLNLNISPKAISRRQLLHDKFLPANEIAPGCVAVSSGGVSTDSIGKDKRQRRRGDFDNTPESQSSSHSSSRKQLLLEPSPGEVTVQKILKGNSSERVTGAHAQKIHSADKADKDEVRSTLVGEFSKTSPPQGVKSKKPIALEEDVVESLVGDFLRISPPQGEGVRGTWVSKNCYDSACPDLLTDSIDTTPGVIHSLRRVGRKGRGRRGEDKSFDSVIRSAVSLSFSPRCFGGRDRERS